jgi:hypothetical protein
MIKTHCTLHTAHCTLHTAHCTLHTAHCTLHTAHCTLHTEHCTLHTAHCTLHTAHCTLHTAHCTLHTAHCTLHTAHCTLHTAHCAPKSTLHTAHLGASKPRVYKDAEPRSNQAQLAASDNMQTRSKKNKATTTCPPNLFSMLPSELVSKIAAYVVQEDMKYQLWSGEWDDLEVTAKRLVERRGTVITRIHTEFPHWPLWLHNVLVAEEYKRIRTLNDRVIATMKRINNSKHKAFTTAFNAQEEDVPFLTSRAQPLTLMKFPHLKVCAMDDMWPLMNPERILPLMNPDVLLSDHT